MRAVLGVGDGGSKTHALVADERGEVLGFASGGRSNWEDTGLEAAGRDPAGRAVRTLGLGPMYGDFGSATDVATEAVRAVADAYTGRGPATSLSRLLPPLAGCASAEQLLQRLSRGIVPLPPAAAPLVLAEAEAGDPACRQIVLQAGASLGSSAAVVARRLGLGGRRFKLVMAGGLFRSRNRLLEGTLVDTLHRQAPLATPVHLTCKPVVGPPWRPSSWPACPPTRACATAWSPPPRAWPSPPVRDRPGRSGPA